MSQNWVSICSLARLRREQRLTHQIRQQQILIVLIQNSIYAFENRCPHLGYSLLQGYFDPETQIFTCPFHHWQFQLPSGTCLHNQTCLNTFEIRLQNDMLWLRLPESMLE